MSSPLSDRGKESSVICLHDIVSLERTLGSGSYAHVFACRIKENDAVDELCACKETKPDTGGMPHLSALRECSALALLFRLPGIPPIKGLNISHDDCTVKLVMPLYPHCLLRPKENRTRILDVGACRCVVRTLVYALAHTHVRGLTHRDIKPENIMFERDPQRARKPTACVDQQGEHNGGEDYGVRLIDWGLCRHSPTSRAVRSPYVVTRWYRAPEILLGFADYGPPCDIWSLGATVAEMLTGHVLFPGRDQLHQLHLIFSRIGSPRQETWPAAVHMLHKRLIHFNSTPVMASGRNKLASERHARGQLYLHALRDHADAEDFVARCLTLDPTKRLTALHAMQHPFIASALGPPPLPPPPSRLDAMAALERQYFRGFAGLCTAWSADAERRAMLLDWVVEVHHKLKNRSLALSAAIHLIHSRFRAAPYPGSSETAGVVALSALCIGACTYGASHVTLESAARFASVGVGDFKAGVESMLRAAVSHGGAMQPTWLHFLDAAAEAGAILSQPVEVPAHDFAMPLQGAYTLARYASESACVYGDACLLYLPSEIASAAIHVGVLSCFGPRQDITEHTLHAATRPARDLLGMPSEDCVRHLLRCAAEAARGDLDAVRRKYSSTGTSAEWLLARIHSAKELSDRMRFTVAGSAGGAGSVGSAGGAGSAASV